VYTNHTLVQAVRSAFSREQFEKFVMPNVQSPDVRDMVHSFFQNDELEMDALAIEVSRVRTAVSKLHADVADFRDSSGGRVSFRPVTNGISNKWINPKLLEYYRELEILDRFSLPTPNFFENLQQL